MKKRVVITGLGAITPIGNTAEAFWQALLAGQSGIGMITRFDASEYDAKIAGEVYVGQKILTKVPDVTNVIDSSFITKIK